MRLTQKSETGLFLFRYVFELREELADTVLLKKCSRDKILKEVMKDIKNLKTGNKIIETVLALEMSIDNSGNILSQEANTF